MLERIQSLRKQLTGLGIDGLLVTSATNRRYITGFTGTAGAALITSERAVFLTDSRYTDQAKTQAQAFEVIQHSDSLNEQIAAEVSKLGITKLGFEKDFVTYTAFTQYQEQFRTELIPISDVIEKLRMVKSAEEIQSIKTAAKIADAAFLHILQFIRPGITEKEVANELEFTMRKHGAISSAYDTIIASGFRSALPHGIASDKLIERGDMVTMDFGAYVNGYRSDMTRTIAVGEPSAKMKEIYRIVLETELQAIDMVKPGIACKDVETFTHGKIEQEGYGPYFGHGSGHGIGLDIHEEPFFSLKSDKHLEVGMIVTMEPGIYLPSEGGVRIEDDLLITSSGCEVITLADRELIIL